VIVKEFKELFGKHDMRFYMCGEKDVTDHPKIDSMIVIGSCHNADGSIDVDVMWS